MDIDLSRACRSCLRESNDMYQIRESAKNHNDTNFDWKDLDLSIAEVIEAITIVKIAPGDGFPQSVCGECLHQIQQAFSYKKMCEASDDKLRQCLTGFDAIVKIEPLPEIKEEMELVYEPESIHVSDFAMNVNEMSDGDDPTYEADFDDDVDQHDDDDDDDDDQEEINEPQIEIKLPTKIIQSKEIPIDVDEQTIMKQAQIIDGRYQCEFCEKSLADRQTYKLHIRLHLQKNLKVCKFCSRGFAKQNHLDRHLATHAKTFKCDYCSRKFLTSDEQKHHSETCSKKQQIIEKANEKLYEQEQKRQSNRKSKDDNDSDYEPETDDADRVRTKESQKMQNIPFDEEELELLGKAKKINGRYQCPLCTRTLAHQKILKLHIRMHVGRNLLRCRICQRGFAKGSNLNRHMLMHEREKNDNEERIIAEAQQPNGSYCCQFCMKVLLHKQSFRFHLKLHGSHELMHCDICNKNFAEKDELEKHMSVHGDHFPCDKCSEIFTTFRNRRQHIKNVHEPEEVVVKPPRIAIKEKTYESEDEKFDDEDEQMKKNSQYVNGRYECKLCNKTLANKTTLRLHLRLHAGKKLKKCLTCGHGFAKKSHLDRHLKTHLKANRECNFCHETFDSIGERKAHMVAVHKDAIPTYQTKTAIISWTQANGKKLCECMICNAQFNRIAELRTHLDWHANTSDWIAENDLTSKLEHFKTFDEFKCGQFTNDDIANVLQAKLKEKSSEMLKMYRITNESGWELSLSDSETEADDDGGSKRIHNCGKCSKTFDRLHKLMCHMKGDHSTSKDFKEFQCGYCLQCYPNESILAKHLRQQCGNQGKSMHCSMCYSRFAWQDSLDKHFAIYHSSDSVVLSAHMQQRPFSCDQCSRSFFREDQLENHRKRHLPQEKRFSCDICQKKFSRFDNMRSHMRIHVPPEEREVVVNKHLCSYCGRSFSNSSNLVVHIRRHTGERPYACDFESCTARFPRSSDLRAHIRTHTGEKPCLCLVCGKRFSRSNKLVRHMRIHTGEKPYQCTHCDRAFTQSNDLTLHIRRHTGDKPFVCTALYCNERFITNSLLQQHRRAQGHFDESNETPAMPSNHVGNPNRKFSENDGKRTGANTGEYSGGTNNIIENVKIKPILPSQTNLVNNQLENNDKHMYSQSTSYTYMG